MKNFLMGILLGILIGIASAALDNLLLEYAASYEPPGSKYNLEQPDKKTKRLDLRLKSPGRGHGDYV